MYGYAAGAGSNWFLALRLGSKGKGLLLMYLPGIFHTQRYLPITRQDDATYQQL